jgi:hypothetical protein
VLLYKGPDAATEIDEAAAEIGKRRLRLRVVKRYELPDNLGTRTMSCVLCATTCCAWIQTNGRPERKSRPGWSPFSVASRPHRPLSPGLRLFILSLTAREKQQSQ